MTTDDSSEMIRVYCEDPGAFHEQHGRSWIETFQRMTTPGTDGISQWRAREQERSRKARSGDVLAQAMGREHRVTETVLDGAEQPLNDLDRRNTRSRPAAIEAGKVRARRADPAATEDQTSASAEAYADSLGGHRITYTLTCRCGVSLRARSERLQPVLELLAVGGMRELTLRGLQRVYGR